MVSDASTIVFMLLSLAVARPGAIQAANRSKFDVPCCFQVCDPFGADFGPKTACEIIEAIVKDGQQNAPRWNGWGLDMSVDADQPQIQNLTMGHCKSASNRTK